MFIFEFFGAVIANIVDTFVGIVEHIIPFI